MPGGTRKEKAARQAKMQSGLKAATQVPLAVMRLADRAWEPLLELARCGNPATKSDVQVGIRALETGVWGACQNVRINLADVQDPEFKKKTLAEADEILRRAEGRCKAILNVLERRG
jgi:glutamate formiminotransferase/formiminotetrahydrofolate cyclodeaminase